MIDTPQVLRTPAQRVATLHIETPRSKIQEVMGPGIREVMAAVQAQGIGPTGRWFAHHHKITATHFAFGICVPVSAPVTPVGRVKPGERPALQVVRTVYRGGYEGLGGAWQALDRWTGTQGHKTASDLYECYLVGPESGQDPSQWQTELSRPLVG